MTRLRDARVAVAASILLAAGYAGFGLFVLKPEGIYSGDIGVKFVQAKGLATSRFTSLDLPYPGGFLDPQRQFFPVRPPFVMNSGGETHAIFSPASAVLQALPAAAADIRGLVVLSVVFAGLALLATAWIAPPGRKTLSVLAFGVGSPLWLYAVVGWDHAPAAALSTMAVAVALALPRRSGGLLAGILLGAGVLLRDEVLLLAPGLLLILAFRHRSVRAVAAAVAAIGILLACGAAIESLWFGRPAASHLRHAVSVFEGAGAADTLGAEIPALERMTPRARYETVIQYWLVGHGHDRYIAVFAAALVAALLVRSRVRSALGGVPLLLWLLAMLALAAMDVWELVRAPKWVAGLLRVSPFLACAVLPPPRGEQGRWFGPAVLAAAVAYLLIALIATNTTGGKSLGPRLLLPLFPLLTVAAIERIVAYGRATTPVERAIGATGAALVLAAIVLHVFGTAPAYYYRNHEDAAPVLAAAASDARVIVTDDVFTAQFLFPLYYRKVIFLADSHEARARLAQVLAEAKVPEVLLMSRRFEPGTRLSPLRIRQSDKVGRMYIQYWGRVGRVLN